MQYVIRPEIAVEANSPEEAVAKWKTEGITVNLKVDPRLQAVVGPEGSVGATHVQLATAQARLAAKISPPK